MDIPTLGVSGEIEFLVDTGADSTILGPVDVLFLDLDIGALPAGPRSVGVGGRIATARVDATLVFSNRSVPIVLRVLSPRSRRQQQAVLRLPSLLGWDVLRHYALILEERTGRVLLLEPNEADALNLP